MTQILSSEQMDEILNQLIGQTYKQSHDDDRGCSMGRTGYWLSPKSIVEGIRLALQNFDIEVEDPQEVEDDEA